MRAIKRFSLRTLLLMMLGVAACLGWIAPKRQESVECRQAVDHIKRIGGAARFNQHYADRPRWRRTLLGEPHFVDVLLVDVQHVPMLVPGHGVSPSQNRGPGPTFFGDDDLARLHRATELRFLIICGGDISAAGLHHLEEMTKLENVFLSEMPIGDEAMRELGKRSSIKSLHLRSLPITDEGVKHLAQLVRLESLALENIAVGDSGLSHLENLPELKRLSLRSDNIPKYSPEGINRLKSANPKLQIRR